MIMTGLRWTRWIAAIVVLSSPMCRLRAAEALSLPAPPLAEVYSLVRSNLTGETEAELNRAAVLGFLNQLQTRVTLVTNGVAVSDAPAVPLVSKTAVFDRAYAFARVGRVGPGLSNEVAKAYDQLRATNKLKGIIVDLRFALGQDYLAAGQTADLFFKTEQPLLQWGDTTIRSTAKSTAIDLPLVILINHDTSGAAEALAAALRQADGSLIIGSPSAGHAYLFKEFLLSNGQLLRVASGEMANGSGQPLPRTGLEPDIRITVNPQDEKAFFEDPFKMLAKPFAQAAKPGTNDLALIQGTNHARRRMNEAELVRMQRDGVDLEAEPLPWGTAPATGPVITDPALSRGLDLLKGLTLAFKRH
jgi:Peptidase family S41